MRKLTPQQKEDRRRQWRKLDESLDALILIGVLSSVAFMVLMSIARSVG